MFVFKLSKLTLAGLAVAMAVVAYLLLQPLQTNPKDVDVDLELERFAEMKCLTPEAPTSRNLDYKWLQSVDKWYYPVMSELDAYQTTADAMGVPISQVKAPDVYYRSCVELHWGQNPTPKFFGMGKQVPMEWSHNANGTISYTLRGESGGLGTIPFTDNKSYIFIYACWSNGYASWGAMSSEKELNPEAVAEIHEHAKGLGFLEKHFTYFKYNHCKEN